jgi:hypothetical protein
VKAETDHLQKQSDIETALLDALKSSPSGGALRNQAVFCLEYDFKPVVTVTVDEETQEEQEHRTEPEVVFSKLLNQTLEKHGSYFVLYQKFQEKIKLNPLMPDKEARLTLDNLEDRLAQLNSEKSALEAQLEDREQKGPEEGLGDEEVKAFEEEKASDIEQMKEAVTTLEAHVEEATA